VHQIIVLRGGACADLRPEIEGVKEAVHPHNGHGYIQNFQQSARTKGHAEHRNERKAALHVALIHLACARAKGEEEGQDSVFHHNRSPYFV